MILIIYVIGFLLSYIFIRNKIRKNIRDQEDLYSWEDVAIGFFFSLMWFLTWPTFLFVIKTKTKPPRFL